MKTLCAILFVSIPVLAAQRGNLMTLEAPFDPAVLKLAHTELDSQPHFEFADIQLPDAAGEFHNPEAADVKDVTKSESLVLKILAGLLGILAPLLTALVSKAVLKMHAEEKTSKLAYAGGVVGDMMLAFMREAEAKLAPQLQLALADGVLTQAERDSLRANLVALLKQQAPAAVMRTLQSAFGAALETQLHSVAESAIDHMVEAQPVAAAVAAVVPR